MILIADSGSTTTQWRSIDTQGHIQQARTAGFNPYYQSGDELFKEVQQTGLTTVKEPISDIHFYGAGCNHPEKNQIVETALTKAFPQASIHINSDLLAVARALCGHQPGIACILGTGSNSCYYDGQEIRSNIPPWGTWLGDEGSGSVLGRKLVIAALNDELPEAVAGSFKKRYPDLKETVLDHVYRKPYPNRYLGQYSKFLFHHIKDPWVYQLVYDNFLLFFKRKILKYPESKNLPIHFSGSVGFYFNTILRQVGQDLNVAVKNIVENPIAGLTLYHQSN